MSKRTKMPLKPIEREYIISKDIPAYFSKGQLVYAERSKDGTFIVRPKNWMGPTLINVPNHFLNPL